MEKEAFLRMVQSRAARIAIGASTVRGQGNKGIVAAARGFLCNVSLRRFSNVTDESKFQQTLDACTEELRLAFPASAQHWGIARKALNIFLRDSLYTIYLNQAFDLQPAEMLYELPLDSITAKHLRAVPQTALPHFPGVRHVSPELNAAFQAVAHEEAMRQGIARVHLDGLWWSVSRDVTADLE
jgi:hypothetical protein